MSGELLSSTDPKLKVISESILSLEKLSGGEINRDDPNSQALEAMP